MTISFDSSLLTSYYNAKAGVAGASASSSGASSSSTSSSDKTNSPTGSDTAPRAPWNSSTADADENSLVTRILSGHKFIDSSSQSSIEGASPDYNKLFSLYQGMSALQGLAQKAKDGKLSDNALAQVQRRFTAGMKEVDAYISDTKFDHVNLTEGTLTKELKNTVGVAKTNTTYTADAISTGSASSSVKAFEGDVQFKMTIKKTGTATPFEVNIDLSKMPTGQTRSMSNVVSFINDKLKEQGLSTKFAVNRTPAQPTTQTVNGKSVTIASGQDSYGLQIKGVSYEQVTFSAPDTSDAVYVMQTTGDPTKKITSTSKTSTDSTTSSTTTSSTDKTKSTDVTSSLMKFQTTDGAQGTALADPISKVGDKYWVQGESEQTALPDTVANVRQSVAGADGSVYVLADVNGTVSSQDIKGTQDVALMKYDSAGNLVYTRTLGASETATGYNMAVSSDGKVAITGSVTGALDISQTTTRTYGTGSTAVSSTSTSNVSTTGASPTTSDSFVTVLDSSGVEQWTQRRGASAEDEATAVAFGADGSVYVGGRTKSTMPGASGGQVGSWDSYLMGFSGDGKPAFTTQGGTTGSDTVANIVVNGNTVYTSGVENGDAVVKSYTIGSATSTDANGVSTTKTTATLASSRDLGGIGGGNISGMSLYNGKIYLGGSAGSDKLLASGTVTHGYSGGYDAYALSIDSNLANTGTDTIAYFGGTGVEKDAKVQFNNGTAWIAGSTTGELNGTTMLSTATKAQDGYLAKLDIATGTGTVVARFTGTDGKVTPNAIAVAPGASSVLDRLGLPQGKLLYTDSNQITAGTSVRTGDQFYMVDPDSGVKKTITIDANETLDTLAKKIVRASGYKLDVSVSKVLGKQQNQLDIKPANGSSKMEFVAGPTGRDALAGLGLEPGIVSSTAGSLMDSKAVDYLKSQKNMGLDFDTSLTLNSDSAISNALDKLAASIKGVQRVYTYLKYGDPQESDSKTKGNGSGVAPAYLTSQISNYQAALARLSGGQPTSTASLLLGG
ncbi:transcriptional regulator [Asticcacaulis solisilvae]|uniref:transcriptional regulator n=1 Tax=Asticcacaulis solisilvae TaxID=1217274 RepID=UPI003FD87142